MDQIEDIVNPLVSESEHEQERVREVSPEGDFEDALPFLHRIPSQELITSEIIEYIQSSSIVKKETIADFNMESDHEATTSTEVAFFDQCEQNPRRSTRIAKPRAMSPLQPVKSRHIKQAAPGKATSTKPVANRQKRRRPQTRAQLSKARKVVQKPKAKKAKRVQRRAKSSS